MYYMYYIYIYIYIYLGLDREVGRAPHDGCPEGTKGPFGKGPFGRGPTTTWFRT